MSDYNSDRPFYLLLMVVLIMGGSVAWGWYRAGAQAAIYKRQGIEITRWEIFIGATPAERVVQVRETTK